jgi:hypothetical protein
METINLGLIGEKGFNLNLEALDDLPHIRELLTHAETIYHAGSDFQNQVKAQSPFRELSRPRKIRPVAKL